MDWSVPGLSFVWNNLDSYENCLFLLCNCQTVSIPRLSCHSKFLEKKRRTSKTADFFFTD